MADRHQNINISYNVKTSDLEKVEATAKRAEEATKKLGDAANNAGQKGSASNRGYIRSIESIRVEMQRTRQLIDLTNRADTKLLNQRIAKYRQLKKELQDFNRQVEQSGKAAKSTTTSFFNLRNVIAAAFSVAAVRQVVSMTLELAAMQGNLEGVRRGFNRAFGERSEILLNDLRRATQGTVSDFDLMRKALQAQNLGVGIGNFARLLEFANLRAQQTGESVDHMVDSIVTGIGRKSTRVLDNLGISATRLKEELNGASLESSSLGEVTAAVARIASQEVQKMGGAVETGATKVGKLKVEWDKLKTTVAEGLDTSGTTDFFTDLVKANRLLIEARFNFNQFRRTVQEDARKQQAVSDFEHVERRAEAKEVKEGAEAKRKFIEDEIQKRKQSLVEYDKEIARLQKISGHIRTVNGLSGASEEGRKRLNELREEHGLKAFKLFEQEVDQARERLKTWGQNKLIITETLRLLQLYLDTLEKGNDVEETRLGLIGELEEKIKKAQEAFNTSRSREEMARLNEQLFIMEGELNDLKKTGLPEFKSPEVLERVGKLIDEKIKKGFRDSNRELSNIEEVLQRLQGLIVPVTIRTSPDIRQMDFWDELGTTIEQNWRDITSSTIDITANFLAAEQEAELQSYENRINALQAYYDDQILLAGDNERKKDQLRLEESRKIDQLRKQQALKEKEARRFSIIVDTAASVAKTAAQLGFPAAIPFIALAVANGALQLAALNKAQPRGFFKGEIGIDGPGTSTSDSIPAMLSRGESVINADATRRSRGLLEAVNARKIDDRVLQELHLSRPGAINPKPIIEAISRSSREQMELLKAIANNKPDFLRMGAEMLEAKVVSSTHKQYVRSKYHGK